MITRTRGYKREPFREASHAVLTGTVVVTYNQELHAEPHTDLLESVYKENRSGKHRTKCLQEQFQLPIPGNYMHNPT